MWELIGVVNATSAFLDFLLLKEIAQKAIRTGRAETGSLIPVFSITLFSVPLGTLSVSIAQENDPAVKT